MIPLSRPDISAEDIRQVVNVLKTGNLSLGPKVLEFEAAFSGYIGAKHAIAVSSGTSGLHLCIKALNIGKGDEVITTPFSFIASTNCILYEGGIPVFVDIDSRTYNLDPRKIKNKITKKTKAILLAHVFGQPCEMKEILSIAAKFGLAVIEDACEAIGATYHGRKVGTFGDCAVFGFYPNKQMTTGEGGMILTNRADIARMCRSLRNQGKKEGGVRNGYERLGYNYRLTDMQCALGISQISRIDSLLRERAKAAELYNHFLMGIPEIQIPYIDKHVCLSWFVYVVTLKNEAIKGTKDWIIKALRRNGVDSNDYFPPIHLAPHIKRIFDFKRGDFPIAESISSRTVALPFFTNLKKTDIQYVTEVLRGILVKIPK